MINLAEENPLISVEALPSAVWLALLADDLRRDAVTARRAILLRLVWREAFLSREGLMARTEILLGQGCFGQVAAATFQRDMRAVKAILAAAGHTLKYTRRAGLPGYFIAGAPALDPEQSAGIAAAMGEVDARQIEIERRLSPAVRVQQAGQLSDGLRRMAAQRRQQRQPGLSLAAAYREVRQAYDRLGG